MAEKNDLITFTKPVLFMFSFRRQLLNQPGKNNGRRVEQ